MSEIVPAVHGLVEVAAAFVELRADDLAATHATQATRSGSLHPFARQSAGLLEPGGELGFVVGRPLFKKCQVNDRAQGKASLARQALDGMPVSPRRTLGVVSLARARRRGKGEK
jgi:hypothetical protein